MATKFRRSRQTVPVGPAPHPEPTFRALRNYFEEVLEERIRQHRKWGSQRHKSDFVWSAILTEECGEVSKAVLEDSATNPYREVPGIIEVRRELVQVAAVALAWLDAIDNRPVSVMFPGISKLAEAVMGTGTGATILPEPCAAPLECGPGGCWSQPTTEPPPALPNYVGRLKPARDGR